MLYIYTCTHIIYISCFDNDNNLFLDIWMMVCFLQLMINIDQSYVCTYITNVTLSRTLKMVCNYFILQLHIRWDLPSFPPLSPPPSLFSPPSCLTVTVCDDYDDKLPVPVRISGLTQIYPVIDSLPEISTLSCLASAARRSASPSPFRAPPFPSGLPAVCICVM